MLVATRQADLRLALTPSSFLADYSTADSR